jgi:hypothetical protein
MTIARRKTETGLEFNQLLTLNGGVGINVSSHFLHNITSDISAYPGSETEPGDQSCHAADWVIALNYTFNKSFNATLGYRYEDGRLKAILVPTVRFSKLINVNPAVSSWADLVISKGFPATKGA